MDLDKAIKERKSVRTFKKNKTPKFEEIIEILEAARKSPLAGNIYALRYILVSDKVKIKELAEACQQDFIENVEFIIVVCTINKDLKANYYERGIMYGKQQAGASIQNMLLKITDLGLASCWVGAFSDESIRRILVIPADIDIEALIPVGYELGKTKQQKKPELDDVLFFNSWKNKIFKPLRMTASTST